MGRKPSKRTIKCTLVGDVGVGKTSLISQYFAQRIATSAENPLAPCDNIPQPVTTIVVFKGKEYTLEVLDTYEKDECERDQVFPQTDVFVICFSLESRTSFENVREKWLPEVKLRYPKKPAIFLVGLKSTQIRPDRISYPECLSMAKEIGAFTYRELSTDESAHAKQLFEDIVSPIVEPPRAPRHVGMFLFHPSNKCDLDYYCCSLISCCLCLFANIAFCGLWAWEGVTGCMKCKCCRDSDNLNA